MLCPPQPVDSVIPGKRKQWWFSQGPDPPAPSSLAGPAWTQKTGHWTGGTGNGEARPDLPWAPGESAKPSRGPAHAPTAPPLCPHQQHIVQIPALASVFPSRQRQPAPRNGSPSLSQLDPKLARLRSPLPDSPSEKLTPRAQPRCHESARFSDQTMMRLCAWVKIKS